MLCKYVNDNTVDIYTSLNELKFLGLAFSIELDKMRKDDVNKLINFLIDNAAAEAGYLPPQQIDDYDDEDDYDEDDYDSEDDYDEDYDDFKNEENDVADIRINAIANPQSNIICFRLKGLRYSKTIPSNHHIETFPGSDEGFENTDVVFGPSPSFISQKQKEEEYNPQISEKTPNDIKSTMLKAVEERLNTPEGRALFERLQSLVNLFTSDKEINALYLTKAKGLEDIKKVINNIPDEVIKDSSIYKFKDEYYLKFTLHEPISRCTGRVMMLTEFSTPYINRAQDKLREVAEHGKLLIKSDVKKILEKTLF